MTGIEWVPSSKCCKPNCHMTLCTPIGAGLMLCWLHVLVMGLFLDDAARQP